MLQAPQIHNLKPVLAISNAKARSVSQKGSKIQLSALPRGSKHHISRDKSDLGKLLEQAKNDKIAHILIEGGDGTVRMVMTALLNSYEDTSPLPAVSILPSGTTNQIARNVGLKNFSDMRTIVKGDVSETSVPLVKIEIVGAGKESAPPYFGFLFSTGALPHVSKFAQEKFNKNGVGGGTAVVGAFLKVMTGNKETLMPPEKHKMRARIGEQTIFKHKGKALGTMMTTLPTLMMGLDPFWGHEAAPLRLTWAEADSRHLGRNVAGLWMGRKQDRGQDGFHSHNIDRLVLRTLAPAVLDGDFIDISGAKIRVSASRPVRFWQSK
ncbi:diacylglycerol kinase-like protein [Litorimonas taeanensis]|uniref:Diacylglycerol kinase-like protein n=1 Tax=Litorimonas taeanensis TaxID=568099 RepID=A0A420WKW7_9PROT|nr:acylglycerol kinase family protein [Litorimonas taeanensis]RKQ71556.1 diacylglycerol kinase-like protein [Litorimonas taeanensis]